MPPVKSKPTTPAKKAPAKRTPAAKASEPEPTSDERLASVLALEGEAVTQVEIVPGASPVKRPDLTPAQLIAGVPVIANLLAAFGVYSLSDVQQAALTDTLQYALVLVGADAIIRVGRNIALR